MRKLKSIIVLVVCLSFGSAFAGLLENGALDQMNNSIAFGGVGFNLDYKETFLPTDNTSINGVAPKSTESGTILGLFLSARKAFVERIYTDLYLDYLNDKIKYDGILVNSNNTIFTPFSGNFWHKFFNADLKSGYIFTFTDSNSFQVIPYIGVGYRYWDRLSNTISREKYQHYKAIVGLKLNWWMTDSFILSPYVEGGKIFSARMEYCKGSTSYKLGNKPIYTAGLEFNYKIFDEFFLNGFASYTQFKYGRSEKNIQKTADESILTSFEPDSKTRELKFGLGIRYSWMIN